jgi:hypothetical protein
MTNSYINFIIDNSVRARYDIYLNNNSIYNINERYYNYNSLFNFINGYQGVAESAITFATDMKYVGEQCSICWENVENVETMAVTKCSTQPHVFHKDCINKWMSHSSSCPNCRHHL